jgi:hypothetical protein
MSTSKLSDTGQAGGLQHPVQPTAARGNPRRRRRLKTTSAVNFTSYATYNDDQVTTGADGRSSNAGRRHCGIGIASRTKASRRLKGVFHQPAKGGATSR